MDHKTQHHSEPHLVRDMLKTSLGWELALPIFLGVIAGHQIDRVSDTRYLFTLVLTLLGIAIGYYSLIREIQLELLRLKVRQKREQEEQGT